MNSSAVALPEPPRARPFGGGGVHRNGGFLVVSPHQLVYRDPSYPHRSAKSRKSKSRTEMKRKHVSTKRTCLHEGEVPRVGPVFEKALESRPRDGSRITGIVRVTRSRAIPGSLHSIDFFGISGSDEGFYHRAKEKPKRFNSATPPCR
jgi:hypothetical protein